MKLRIKTVSNILALGLAASAIPVMPVKAESDFSSQLATLINENMSDYIESVQFRIDHERYTVNNQEKKLDAAPQIIDGRTMLPARAVAEALGGEADYDNETHDIKISKDDTELTMQAGNNNITVSSNDGQSTITADVAPTIVNDRTLVPVRVISETLGTSVTWDGDTSTVTIVPDYQTKRLIIKSDGRNLDFERFNPKKVITDDNGLYIVQFKKTIGDATIKHYAEQIEQMNYVEYVDPDIVLTESSDIQYKYTGSDSNESITKTRLAEYATEIGRDNLNKVKIGIIELGQFDQHKDFAKDLILLDHDKGSTDDGERNHATIDAGIIDKGLRNIGTENYEIHGYSGFSTVIDSNNKSFGFASDIKGHIEQAIIDGCQLINLSFATYLVKRENLDYIDDAVKLSAQKGVLLVIAAGNFNDEVMQLYNGEEWGYYPAAFSKYDNVITVAATDFSNSKYVKNNYSDKGYVDIAAPGVDITGYGINNRYCVLSGTSQAAPHVTAAAALLKAKHNYTPAELKRELKSKLYTVDINDDPNHRYGVGTLNMYASEAPISPNKTLTSCAWDTQAMSVAIGSQTKPVIKGTYSDGTTADVSSHFTLSSSDSSVAAIENGAVKGVKAGTATITASSSEQDYSVTGSITVTVTEAPQNAVLTGYEVLPKNVSVVKGDTADVKAYAVYSDGTRKDITDTVGWVAHDTSVASVSNGHIKGLSEGRTNVTISFAVSASESFAAPNHVSVTVTEENRVMPSSVTPPPFDRPQNDPNSNADSIIAYRWSDDSDISLAPGETANIKVYAVYSSGREADVTSSVGVTSTDTNVVTVNSVGKLKAVGSGKSRITISMAASASVSMPRPITVTVDRSITGYEWSDSSFGLKVGDSEYIKLYAVYNDGTREDVTSQAGLQSTDPDVASVTNSGMIIANGAGKARITMSVAASASVSMPGPVTVNVEDVRRNVSSVIYGDINGDGKINTRDVSAMQNIVLGESSPTSEQEIAADLDGNGRIDDEDLTLLRKRVMGSNTPFPVEE